MRKRLGKTPVAPKAEFVIRSAVVDWMRRKRLSPRAARTAS
jgi:hypothetical protein